MSKYLQMYDLLFKHFGTQSWWPGDTPLEICIGAILTQNTNWTNVEKAIQNLKQANKLSFEALLELSHTQLADLIRPAGYFNVKAKRLQSFLNRIKAEYDTFESLNELSQGELRAFLLSVKGIGPETADSMVLYAFNHPEFVVDAYTKRILLRHRMTFLEAGYHDIQSDFLTHLETDKQLFNEFHALIVMTGKNFCKKSKPKCELCPLKEFNGGVDLTTESY